jgi:hypothetical protein
MGTRTQSARDAVGCDQDILSDAVCRSHGGCKLKNLATTAHLEGGLKAWKHVGATGLQDKEQQVSAQQSTGHTWEPTCLEACLLGSICVVHVRECMC